MGERLAGPRSLCAALAGVLPLSLAGVAAAADLRISSHAPAKPRAGSEYSLTLTVNNDGPDAATGVSLSTVLSVFPDGSGPAPAGFVAAVPSVGTCSATMPIVCDMGTVAPNDSEAVTLRFTPVSISIFYMNARVTATTPDADPSNNAQQIGETTQTYARAGQSVDDVPPYLAFFTLSPTLRAGTQALRLLPMDNPNVWAAFLMSEQGAVKITFDRITTGRRAATGKCTAFRRSNASRRPCWLYSRVASEGIETFGGEVGVSFGGRIGGVSIRPGLYRVRFAPVDRSGNAGVAMERRIRIVAG